MDTVRTPSVSPTERKFARRRTMLTLPETVAEAVLDAAAANQRPWKRELLRLVIDQLKVERWLPRDYVP